MRKIREVLRLHFDCGFRQREIARAVGTSPTTVGQYVRRMQRAGLSWPLSATLSDDELEALLFPPPPQVEGKYLYRAAAQRFFRQAIGRNGEPHTAPLIRAARIWRR
jgi:hypothetical protein